MTGPRVFVCPLLDANIGQHYAAWFQDPAIRRFIKFARQAPTVDNLRAYRAQMAMRADVDFLGIFLNSDGRHIGNLKFETGPLPDEMHVGFLIGDPDWRRAGTLSEILPLCIAHLFSVRRLRRLYLTVDPINAAGIRAFTKLGFVNTGNLDRAGDLEMDYRRSESPREVGTSNGDENSPAVMLDRNLGSVVRIDLEAIPNSRIISTLIERYYRSEMPDTELSSHLRMYSSAFQLGTDEQNRLVAAPGEGLGVVRWNSLVRRLLDRACITSHRFWLDDRAALRRTIRAARRICRAMRLQLTMDVFRQVCTVVLIARHLEKIEVSSPRFLMIGDGYGVLSSLLKWRYPDASVVVVDLGRPLLFQSYLNQRAHPGSTHTLVGENSAWADADFVYCPAEQLDLLAGLHFDAAANIASMQEMTTAQIGRYFSFLRQALKPRNLFYCCNRERKELEGGDVSEFNRYPWSRTDRILVNGTCPWHRYFFSIGRIGGRQDGLPVPVIARYDGRVLHRLVEMATG